jgi:predicted dehydrogenase
MNIRVAIIGAGSWARIAHVPALKTISGVDLIACVDETMEKARAFADALSIQGAYRSLEDLIASADRPDMLIIATPNCLHAPMAKIAIEAGIPIFCEKPLANYSLSALDLALLAEHRQIAGTVGFSFRYTPILQALRKDMLAGAYGEPWLIELSTFNPMFHPASGIPVNWKADPAFTAAGVLFDFAPHLVDMAQWLVGPINSVAANLSNVLSDSQLDDICSLQLRFHRPAIGLLTVGWVLSGDFPGIQVRIHGSNGTAVIMLSKRLPGCQEYHKIALDGSIRESVQLKPITDPFSDHVISHQTDFIALLRGEPLHYDNTLPTLADGASVQVILDAALKSNNNWVLLEDLNLNKLKRD